MAEVVIYEYDAGTRLTARTKADSLGSATVRRFHLTEPDGTFVTVDATTYDATAKTISWDAPKDYWVGKTGLWLGQVFIQYSDARKFYGDPFEFSVKAVLS